MTCKVLCSKFITGQYITDEIDNNQIKALLDNNQSYTTQEI